MKNLSLRERTLLLVALMTAVGIGYWALRLRPQLKALDVARHSLAAARARVENVTWPKVEGDAQALARHLADLRVVVTEAESTLRAMEKRFVSIAMPDALEDLRLQMSARASACRVRFRENVICPQPAVREFLEAGGRSGEALSSATRLARFLVAGEPYALPVREVAFDASFGGLCSLLQGLAELPGEVVILRFEIDVKEDARQGPTPLATRLLLVF